MALSLTIADSELAKIEDLLTLLPDSPLAHIGWKRLVVRHGVRGVHVNDARAVGGPHGVRRILTFDANDFAGMTSRSYTPLISCSLDRLRAGPQPLRELFSEFLHFRRHHKSAIRLIRVILEILLVIILSGIELSRRVDRRHDRIRERLFRG